MDDDAFAFLSEFDTVFIIDDSESMSWPSGRGIKPWDEVADVLRAITPICTKYDSDGIDIYFLNHKSRRTATGKASGGYYNIRSASDVTCIFDRTRPNFRTPTGKRLEDVLGAYMQQYRVNPTSPNLKPLNVIVITDGVPTDCPEGVLSNVASELTRLHAPASQLGVQFFQVGTELSAKESLIDLDDGMKQDAGRDIVDAVTFDDAARRGGNTLTADGVLKVVLGAVVRRLDRKPMAVR